MISNLTACTKDPKNGAGQCEKIHPLLKWSILSILLLNVVVAPFVWYRSYHPDWHTITTFGRRFIEGRDLYVGGNPYLPSSMLLWSLFSFFDKYIGWLIWKGLAATCIILTLAKIHAYVRVSAGSLAAWLCILNLGVLAGFTPKSGNPGNIAAPLAVLAVFLLMEKHDRLGGVLIGLVLSLKYPLGIPILGLALVGRKFRFALWAIGIMLLLNLAAIGWFLAHGREISEIPASILLGVQHVGGFESDGFHAWFSRDTRGKYSTLSSAALLHTIGVPFQLVQPVSLSILLFVTVISALAIWRGRVSLVLGLSMFSPAFLTLTYHRYYDSALIAFPVVTAWCVVFRNSLSRVDRILAACAIGFSAFLVRSLAYTITNRLNASQEFLQSPLYNLVLGPLHLYAMYILCLTCIYWYFRYARSSMSHECFRSP